MNSVSELSAMLKGIFSWNKSRIDCFSQLLLALFQVKTVNLREIALAFHGPAKIDSCYKRIKRFFAQVHFDQLQIACWLLSVFFDSTDKIYLTIDRKNWFWGKKKINLLMIAVAYEGMAIPLFWKALPKAGNSSAQEHQQLIQRFVKTLGQTNIALILASGNLPVVLYCIG